MRVVRSFDELNAVVQSWKDDYVLLLQSCIAVPCSVDVADVSHVKLFGGDAVCMSHVT